jgi:chaperone modulatory protein CbpM
MVADELIVFDFEHGAPLYSFDDVCRMCGIAPERVIELIEFGVLEPEGAQTADWRFPAQSILRTRRADRLQRDLDLNLPGLALALDLLDEIQTLRQQAEALQEQLARFTQER